MHIADPDIGIFGANGIVGAGLPIAVGAATAAQLRADGSVAVAFFGDGAVAQGAFHEAVNLAAVWQLPGRLLLREQPLRRVLRRRRPARRARSSSAPPGTGSATSASTATTWWPRPRRCSAVVDGIRAGGGPVDRRGRHLPLARPLRGRPRSTTAPPRSAPSGEARDPLLVHADRLRAAGVADDAIEALEATVARELDAAVDRRPARRRTRPRQPLFDFVTRPRPEIPEPAAPAADAPVFRTMDAIHDALEAELAADDRVFVAGIDVGRGRQRVRPHRAACTSASATASATRRSPRRRSWALGVGAAMAGMRPVVELMYLDFVGVCLDQLHEPGRQDAVHDRRRRPDGR